MNINVTIYKEDENCFMRIIGSDCGFEIPSDTYESIKKEKIALQKITKSLIESDYINFYSQNNPYGDTTDSDIFYSQNNK